ncbi:NAD(P)-binding domain-containing protein [Bradyrhizobium sp. BRP22]|nr:NAD(P)-binding domain-containing protein [Bradyrhizobium sp. BRP22]
MTRSASVLIAWSLMRLADASSQGELRERNMGGRGIEEKRVGIVGLGIMGGAISANLVQRGWSVIGYDIDEARRHEAAEAGVTVVENVSQVAARSRTIMTSLPTPAAAQMVGQTIAHESSPHTVL